MSLEEIKANLTPTKEDGVMKEVYTFEQKVIELLERIAAK